MKKLYFYSILCLVLCLGGIATAEVKVFYLPDSGYLRVEAQLAMEPSSAPLSFLVFPNAQITEFWVEGLENYQIERGSQGTVVTFSVGTLAHSPILDLSYEGFLSLEGNQITLDRDTLWFPEFSFPVRPPTFTAELPQEWEINMSQIAKAYPEFTVQRKEHLSEDNLFEDNLPVEQLPQVEQAPPTEEFLSRIQIQVARLVNLINNRNTEGIENLVSSNLQQQGLPLYLASFPKTYGGITSEFLTQPTFAEEPFQVVFITQKGSMFLATMSWHEANGALILQNFSLVPASQQVPPVVEQSLKSFIQTLQTAVQLEEKDQLESLISPQSRVEQIREFLYTLNTSTQWEIKYIALEPLSITVFVPHSPQMRLLLNLGLSPGEENWLIDTLDVVPLR